MSAPAQMPEQIGQARDGFTTDAENWPPNVKSAHKTLPDLGAFGA